MYSKYVDYIADYNISEYYISVVLDWNTLPINDRQQILKDIMNKKQEYDNEWYYAAYIIPLKNGIADFENAFFYLYNFAPTHIPSTEVELCTYIKGMESEINEYCRQVKFKPEEIIRVLSWFIPSIDGRMRCFK